MDTKTTLDMLTTNNINIETPKYIMSEGVICPLGKPHRKAYINSAQGRAELTEELVEPYQLPYWQCGVQSQPSQIELTSPAPMITIGKGVLKAYF